MPKGVMPLFSVLRRRKWILLLPVLAGFGLASVVAFLLPRRYVSATTIQIEGAEVPREYAAADPRGFADQRLRTITRRVLSAPGLAEVMGRFRLYEDRKGRMPPDEIVGKMREDIAVSVVEADIAASRAGVPASATILFTVGYEGKHPETVRRVAGALAALYLEEDVRIRERRSAEAQGIIEAEMKEVKGILASLDARIAEYRRRHLASMPEQSPANRQALDQVDRDVERTREQRRALRERESYLRGQLEGVPPENPAHIILSAQMAGVVTELDAADRLTQGLEKRRAALRRRLEEAPRVEKGYRALVAERDELQARHDALARKAAEAMGAFEAEKAQRGERFTVVEAARLPARPSSPNVPAILLIGLALGLACGAGWAARKEAADATAHTLEGLAAVLPYPALAAIPEILTPEDERRRNRRGRLALGAAAAAFCVFALLAVLAGGWPR
ncbi:MAG: polysaccharide chain length determinant protein [Deltaproteobacteria bacterium]|nr:polysaccharide chain length determinant protein [Deltaproteobacteria bacterium]